MHEDPGWPRAGHWLSQGSADPNVTILGVPLNHSVTPGRCDLAPDAIRSALLRYSTWDYRTSRDLRDLPVSDSGDVSLLGDIAIQHRQIRKQVAELHGRTVLLGGDNGITWPALMGMADRLNLPLASIGLITLDAHLDLRTLETGPMNGNPVRGLLSEGLPGTNIVQIGIQSFANSPEYQAIATESGITQYLVEDVEAHGIESVMVESIARLAHCDAIYFDLDLDVMDRAFAPGCPGSRPGGITPSQARKAARIAGCEPKVQAMDLVELDPTIDQNDTTALAGAACLLEFCAGTLQTL
ncbi:MAG: agmatinase family protein [Armatimonadetes bacterium]|nr:agmatinase family protein [Armatimonadota bacterium]